MCLSVLWNLLSCINVILYILLWFCITNMIWKSDFSGSGGDGFSDMMHNYEGYQRRLRTISGSPSYHQKLSEACDIRDPYTEPTSSHHETTKAEIRRSETCVQKVLSAINGFMDPFNPPPEHDPDLLYCISSDKPVPKEVVEDVFQANPAGVRLKEALTKECLNLETKCKRVYDPVKNWTSR